MDILEIKGIRRSINASFVSQIAHTGLSFVSTIYIARILGVEGAGAFSLYSSALLFMSIWLGFGIPASATHLLAAGKINQGRLLNSVFVFYGLMVFLVFSGLQLLSYFKAEGMIFPEHSRSVGLRMVFCLQFFLHALNGLLGALANARQKFALSGSVLMLSSLAYTLLLALFYHRLLPLGAGSEFEWVTGLSVLMLVFQLLAGLFFYKDVVHVDLTAGFLTAGAFYGLVKIAALMWLCNSIQFLNYRLDYWILDHFHGKHTTGLYITAGTLAQLPRMLPNAIAGVLFSYVSKSGWAGGSAVTRRYLRRAFALSIPAALFVFLVFYYAIPWLYGAGFTGARGVLGALLTGLVPLSVSIVLAGYFAAAGQVRVNLYVTLLSFVVCLLLDLLLIPRFSMAGAAVATVASYFAGAALHLYLFCKKSKISLRELFKSV